ncbi:hypothetical protein GCM10010218_40850 [Streptomyces mashuensis]|uniref:CGA synthase-related protein n=1 Tax=Streptomyces mashuensis TaxID=33904 RepID=A0A919EEN1_9ACTN|nr:CGA synthase-related protein [Streptomyces mashuensis]GHF55247.1 hypothetical protein GCM10010218_40850 [Streptomyces mashuensis]
MALLTPAGGGPAAPPRPRVLLAAREEQLDSVLARRRVAAHLTGLATTTRRSPGTPPDVALVCDDAAVTGRLLDLGVPVVHLRSGHTPDDEPHDAGAYGIGRALHRVHRPGWLPGPSPAGPGARPTGLLGPARTARDRTRTGALLLLSLWGVPPDEAQRFAAGPLRALVRTAVERTGRCDVVCDTGLAGARSAATGPHPPRQVRWHRAADTDADALHAGCAVLLASPTLAALGLAQARRAPLAFLPPLGAAQADLADRVARLLPVPVAGGPDDAVWDPPDGGPWRSLDPDADDLRGAQRVARGVRQLCLAPP